MLYSKILTAFLAISFGAVFAHPLDTRQKAYPPIPEMLATCQATVGSISTNIQSAIKAEAYTSLATDLATVTNVLESIKTEVALDVGVSLSVILGGYTYEQGVVQVYAAIITQIYNDLESIMASVAESTGSIKAEVAQVTSSLTALDNTLQQVLSPVEPTYVHDVLAAVALDLSVSVSVCKDLLADVGLGGILGV